MGLSIRKNDSVRVISGKYKGVTGRVLAVFPKEEKVLVEGVNVAKKHQRARSQQQPGGIIEKEMPIHVSNLMLVDPKTGKAGRIRNENRSGKAKVRRIATRDGEEQGSEL